MDLHADSVYILVVEDNPADASLLKQALAEHGIHIPLVVMSDGERAMKFVDRVRVESIAAPKLIVLDLNLPRRNGREVLEYLRAQGAWSAVPISVLSSSSAARDRDDAARLGASQYIRKPLDFDEFIAIGGVLKALLKPE
jgi:two-component system, chemotaxis family, response regulator Rcp1